MTWGAMINHSRHQANLRPFIAGKNTDRRRVFFVALHDIPETVEFLWNYNDADWECHANSQTRRVAWSFFQVRTSTYDLET